VAADDLKRTVSASGYSEPGFAARYDRFRPRPPAVLLEWLPRLAGVERPALVVDLGSGTGLSTRAWAGLADEVVGVEPNEAMRAHAEAVTGGAGVRYVAGSSYATGLDHGCADLVTCSQSLQWMEPEPTFREVARILRPGGVFCAYQYESLQTPFWEPEAAWRDSMRLKGRLREELGLDEGRRRWPPSLERLEEAGCFAECRELRLHSVEAGDAERLVGLALSEGSLATLLAAGVTEDEAGVTRLREVAERTIGSTPCAWLIGYRAWVGRMPP
jgi:SAM-dependent methyltransferase